jgi:hypothetical protein
VVAYCYSIVKEDMCLTTGAAGSNTCFWLKDTNVATYGGKCRDANANDLLCSDVADASECNDVKLKDTTLEGICGDYGGSCETKCGELTNVTTETCVSRSDDCFEKLDVDGEFVACIDKVCCD